MELFVQACLAATSDESYRALLRALRSKLASLPKVEPAPDEAPPSRDLIRLLTASSQQQKKKNDAYMGVDVVLPAVINHVRFVEVRTWRPLLLQPRKFCMNLYQRMQCHAIQCHRRVMADAEQHACKLRINCCS